MMNYAIIFFPESIDPHPSTYVVTPSIQGLDAVVRQPWAQDYKEKEKLD